MQKWLEKTNKILKADFPPEAYSSDTSRGFELTSLKAAYVFERLNDAFGLCGYGWKYKKTPFIETKDREKVLEIGVQVSLKYRLPNGKWSKPITNIGGKRLVKNNMTDARKSAITDAITKIASFLGVGHKAFKGLIRVEGGKPAIRGQAPVKRATTAVPGKASGAQIRAIFAISKAKGMTAEGVTTKVKEHFGIKSLTQLTMRQASEAISTLKK